MITIVLCILLNVVFSNQLSALEKCFEINDELCEEKQYNSIFKFLSYAMPMLRTAHAMDGVQIDKSLSIYMTYFIEDSSAFNLWSKSLSWKSEGRIALGKLRSRYVEI